MKRVQTYMILMVVASVCMLSLRAQESGPDAELEEEVMEFYREHLPEMAEPLQQLREEEPARFSERLPMAEGVMEAFFRYKDISIELSEKWLQIKRREFKESRMIGEILGARDPDRREALFEELTNHMDRTYEINLELCRMELEWFEERVREIRKIIEEEKANKMQNIQADLRWLFQRKLEVLERIRGEGLEGEEGGRAEWPEDLEELVKGVSKEG